MPYYLVSRLYYYCLKFFQGVPSFLNNSMNQSHTLLKSLSVENDMTLTGWRWSCQFLQLHRSYPSMGGRTWKDVTLLGSGCRWSFRFREVSSKSQLELVTVSNDTIKRNKNHFFFTIEYSKLSMVDTETLRCEENWLVFRLSTKHVLSSIASHLTRDLVTKGCRRGWEMNKSLTVFRILIFFYNIFFVLWLLQPEYYSFSNAASLWTTTQNIFIGSR